MIDIQHERVITFAQAVKYLPRKRGGKRINPITVSRWAIHGINGRRLDSVKIGRTRVTSVEALQRFIQQDIPQGIRPAPAAATTANTLAMGYLATEGF